MTTIKTDHPGPILVAGAGRMGAALLAGLLDQGLEPGRLVVLDPTPSFDAVALLARHGLTASTALPRLAVPPAVLLLAVKPQIIDAVLATLAPLCGPQTLTLSIAAGRTIASLQRHLPAGSAIVRAMPNTPASIGRGITVLVANAHTNEVQRATAEALMAAVGETAWIADEEAMDAVTAVSGSGPAYVFLLAEGLTEAGITAGLEPGLAARLARATVAGAGELLGRSDLLPATLRENVTSPGGTTAAALAVLTGDPGLMQLLTAAVAAATRRSRELAGG